MHTAITFSHTLVTTSNSRALNCGDASGSWETGYFRSRRIGALSTA